MTEVVISIVTYNHSTSIADCIESVLNQSHSNYSVHLVDNFSTDGTREVLKRYEQKVNIHYSDVNLGFCGGHNFIIRNSESDYVLLVNPDLVLPEEYLEKALNRFVSNKRIGAVAGLLLQDNSDDPAVDSAGMDFHKSRRFLIRNHGERLQNINLKAEYVDGVDGALPLYRRQTIDEVSIDGEFFDEMFFAHKEDWDVSWRCVRAGWKTFFDPDLVAVHPRSFKQENLKVRAQMSKVVKFHAVKNQLILILKNDGWKDVLADFFHIVPRQFLIFIYVVLFERSSLKAYVYVITNLKKILRKRRLILEKIESSQSTVTN